LQHSVISYITVLGERSNPDEKNITAVTRDHKPTAESRMETDAVLSSNDNPLNDRQTETVSAVNDIGEIINATMTVAQVTEKINSLTVDQKQYMLQNHFKPSEHFIFPVTYDGGCNRSFQRAWLSEYPWLVYSQHLDGGFCLPCAMMVQSRHCLGVLVNRPFTKWRKKSEVLRDHASCSYHLDAVDATSIFLLSLKKPQGTIPVMTDSRRADNIQRNRQILRCMADSVLFCARQCIGLRGDNEATNSACGNPGNFRAVLKMISHYNPVLKDHLEQPCMNNAKYTSPRIQNELVDIIGNGIILTSILDEVREAKYFSVLADEVASHNAEEMALCLRFVDKQCDIREEFVGFIRLQRITGEHMAAAILSSLKDMQLDVANLVGQGYDGAASMCSDRVGVQCRIREEAPLASYFHCCGHALNLVISHSCSLPNVRNVIDKIKSISMFFRFSPKRESLLVDIMQRNVYETANRKPLLDLCRTRWAERHDAYGHFYQSLSFIVDALEVIFRESACDIDCRDDLKSGWDSKTKAEAQSFFNSITSKQWRRSHRVSRVG